MKIHAALFGLLLGASLASQAATPASSSVEVHKAWIRWLPADLPAAAYANIVNTGNRMLRIVGVSSPDYRDVSLMQSQDGNDSSSMMSISHLDVPAHGNAKLSPGGYHVMLMHAAHTIKPGDKVPITLTFSDGSKVQPVFSVMPSDASGPGKD